MKHFPKKLWGAALAVLLAVGIALSGFALNARLLSLSLTEAQLLAGDAVRGQLQLLALTVFATLAAAILALCHYKKRPELEYFLLYLIDPGLHPALGSAAGSAAARQMGRARIGRLPVSGAGQPASPPLWGADGGDVPVPVPASFGLLPRL